MMFVAMEVSQGIAQITECGSGVASILCKVNEVEERSHRFHDSFGDTFVASDGREQNTLQIFRLLTRMLFESGKTFRKVSAPNNRLQN